MTHLAGGWASVPVDAKKRLVDGDASGDLYSGIEHALGGKLPSPVTILSAERQVVAGLNWRVLVLDGEDCYEAIILQKLPCYGGDFVLTSFKSVPRPADPVAHPLEDDQGSLETLEECDQSVSFALQCLSEQSNSLAPFELVRLVRANRTGSMHDLHLEVRQGVHGSPISVELLIEQGPSGFRVEKLAFL